MEGEGPAHLQWEEEQREKDKSFGIFDVYRVTRVSPRGQRGEFVIVDAPDWVTVVPVLKDDRGTDCFVMVRQFRHGSQTVTVEFPAGVIERGEEPEDAARRELLEETGRTSSRVVLLGKTNPNPAFMCNSTFTYLATGLAPPTQQELDELELVELELIPVEEATAKMGTPPYDSAIMMSALAYYLRFSANDRNESRTNEAS